MKVSDLKYIAPNITQEKLSVFLPLLNQYMHEYNICGRLRESAFIATIIWESGSFKYTREIASGKAYEGRKDLGNIYKGDGERFRGRGLIMVTGRTNYEQVSKALNIDFVDNPEILEQPEWAVRSACWWWNSRDLNAIADTGDFRKVTRIVNGGYTHLKEREFYYEKALEILV